MQLATQLRQPSAKTAAEPRTIVAMALSSAKVSTFARGTVVKTAPLQRVRGSHHRSAPRVVPKAKYGQENQYFDLNDLENTLGSWDMYGEEDEKRYPGLQNEFFERAGSSLTRREALRAVLFLGGGASIVLWGAVGAKDVSLPINKGPKTSGEKGPRGKI